MSAKTLACESCGAASEVQLPDGSRWCRDCDRAARRYEVVEQSAGAIRSTHPYAFRSGEWGRIVTTDEVNDRPCWLVAFDDGATDVWVIDDPDAGYEFA